MATNGPDRLDTAIEQLKALNRKMIADRWAVQEREALAAEHRRLDQQSVETFARIESKLCSMRSLSYSTRTNGCWSGCRT